MPDERFTVAILANAEPGKPDASPQRLAYELMAIFLAEKLAPLPTVNTKVSPKSYDALTGRYSFIPGQVWGRDGAVITISRRGTQLFGQVDDQPEVELFPESDTKFFLKVADAQITFVKDSNGKVVKITTRDEHGIELDTPRENEKKAIPQ